MPDFLLELLSEEIPARMQARAADNLKKLVTDALVERGLAYEGAKAFATPRRLALVVGGLPGRQPDRHEERKGPRVGAPEKALEGFLKASGLTSIDQATVQSDPKGDFYVARTHKHGAATTDVISEIMPGIVRAFPWPKSMRWGAGSLRWVRPLHSIVATFAAPQEEPEVVRFEIDGIVSGDVTRGHRVHAPGEIRVKRFEDYVASLEKAHVILDPERRRDIIRADARTLAQAQNLELVEDEALLEEVAGLVEWPVVLMGRFEPEFLDVPDEAIRATIRANQKCFVLKNPATGRLTNRFILTANLDATDGGKAIVHGNERVVRARLSDARFFWETDKKTTLDSRLEKLKSITFHEKLGTQYERVERIARLAKELAPLVGADPGKAETAARLAKADLVTEMVGEFPELQGLMGRYYAAAEGQDSELAAAIEDHYKPQGPSDRTPTAPVSIAVALADKIDTLVGFWAIDEKPTGSKDPYALRRAALGVVHLLIENNVRININDAIFVSTLCYIIYGRGNPFFDIEFSIGYSRATEQNDEFIRGNVGIYWFMNEFDALKDWKSIYYYKMSLTEEFEWMSARFEGKEDQFSKLIRSYDHNYHELENITEGGLNIHKKNVRLIPLRGTFDRLDRLSTSIGASVLAFLFDRLKVQLREQGARHDLVDAVFAAGAIPPLAKGRVALGDSQGSGGDRAGSSLTPEEAPTRPSLREGHPPHATREEGLEGTNDDLVLVVARVEALSKLLATDDGKNLLAGYRRAANILKAEEKKDGAGAFEAAPDEALLSDKAEIDLARALDAAEPAATEALVREDFTAATAALAKLRLEVDAFFDDVTVNAPDPGLRANRLRLLARFRRATRAVADFDRIAG